MSSKTPTRHCITDWICAPAGTHWLAQGSHSKLLPPEYVHHLPHEYMVLPEAMKEAGYKTFFAGKWHLGDEGYYPQDNGLDINKGRYEAGVPYSVGLYSTINYTNYSVYTDTRGMSMHDSLS